MVGTQFLLGPTTHALLKIGFGIDGKLIGKDQQELTSPHKVDTCSFHLTTVGSVIDPPLCNRTVMLSMAIAMYVNVSSNEGEIFGQIEEQNLQLLSNPIFAEIERKLSSSPSVYAMPLWLAPLYFAWL